MALKVKTIQHLIKFSKQIQIKQTAFQENTTELHKTTIFYIQYFTRHDITAHIITFHKNNHISINTATFHETQIFTKQQSL